MRPLITCAALACAASLAACGGSTSPSSDKAGGDPDVKARVLRLADTTSGAAMLDAFAAAVERQSEGRLKISVESHWREGEPDAELGVIADVKGGKADLGWAGSRVWDDVGVKSLDALHAPFLIDSLDLEEKVLAGPFARKMLAGVEKAGVEGLAILPGPMRLLLTRHDVTEPSGLDGRRILIQRSQVAEETLAELGAEAVPSAPGDNLEGLDGAEQQAAALSDNHYYDQAKYLLADQPMWARPAVVFASPKLWASLPAEDRDALARAGAEARSATTAAVAEADRLGLESLCRHGVETTRLGEAGRAELRAAVEPVYERLRRDPLTRDAIAAIERLRGGSSAPRTLACPGGGKDTKRATLTGTFTATLRKADPGAHSHPNIANDLPRWPAGGLPVKSTFEDGRVVQMAYYTNVPETGFDETYTVFRDHIQFGGEGGLGFEARWELDGDTLRFTDVTGGADDKFVWQRTWKRAR